MHTISESEFGLLLQTNSIRQLKIVQTGERSYKVVVNLSGEHGEWTVVKVRGGIREWASVDRICRSIMLKCHDKVPHISLVPDLQFKPSGELDEPTPTGY